MVSPALYLRILPNTEKTEHSPHSDIIFIHPNFITIHTILCFPSPFPIQNPQIRPVHTIHRPMSFFVFVYFYNFYMHIYTDLCILYIAKSPGLEYNITTLRNINP